uniref:Ketosynthase family 3 (KS3) domain-containing protein n=1 Tax=Tetranychus urticae TaxID=32264 RepID=T1JX10_TETUR
MTINMSQSKATPIAVTGLAGRFPQSDNVEELWDHLLNGRVLYQSDDFPYPKIFNKTPKSRGALKDTSHFDSDFFGYDRKSANFLDPQLRILLEVVYEALWDAEVNGFLAFHVKVIMYCKVKYCVFHRRLGMALEPLIQHFPSRVSYHFNWKGPSMIIDTACASSLNALTEAYSGLINGTCDQAIVAGICLHLKPNVTICFSELEMLSKSGKSRCLDTSADGYIRSEAIVAIVLQRENLSNRVYGKVIGFAASSDGYTKEGITYPSREVQINTMKLALNRSSINPMSVEYVEGHVTGTSVGDPIETAAIVKAYRSTNTESPLIIGCLKGNIGHTEASAGVCALIKALKIFQNSLIPMNVGMEVVNPRIESLRDGQLITPRTNLPWNGNIIGVNAFGFGGSNTHCLITASDKRHPVDNQVPKNSRRLICFCNRTEKGLRKMSHSIQNQCRSNEYLALIDKIAIGTTIESGMYWRGFSILRFDSNTDKTTLTDLTTNYSTHRLPIVMFFDQVTSDLPDLNSDYDPVNVFLDRKVETCYDYLKKQGYQRKYIEENSSIVLVIHQLAWADLLVNDLKIQPDLVAGYSLGSIAASFAAKQSTWNNCLSKLADNIRLQAKPSKSNHTFRNKFESELSKMRFNDLVNCYKNMADSDVYIYLDRTIDQVETSELAENIIANYNVYSDILVILGEIYASGTNLNLSIFNNQQFPVSSSCPSLGHLIEWDHKQTFDTIVYPDFFRDSFHTVHRVDLMDPEFSDLAGYSIENELICPISCYIWIIWDHLVKLRCTDQRHRYNSFELRSLKVIKLVNLSEPVEFRVTSNPDTGEFAIKYAADYCPIVTGFAKIIDKNTFDYSSYLTTNTENSTDEPIILTSEEVYADLLIRGLSSDESFKSITSFNSSQSQATIKFDGHWITFFESILISPLILDSYDSIMARPVQLDWFRCDPLILNESLKNLKRSGSEINAFTFQLDVDAQIIATKGLITTFPNYQQVPNTTGHPELHYRHQVFLPLNCQLHSQSELNNNQLSLVERIDYLLSLVESKNKKKQIDYSPYDKDSTLLKTISSIINSGNTAINPETISNIDCAFEREMTSKNCGDLLHIHLGLFEENSPSTGMINIYQVGRVNAYSYDSNCDLTFRKIRSNYTFELQQTVKPDSLSSADLVIYNHSSLGLSINEVNIDDEYALCKLVSGVKSKNQISSKRLVDHLLQNDFIVISEHTTNNGCPIKSIILRKVQPNSLSTTETKILYISERTFDWVDKLKSLVDDSDDKIWLISNGCYRTGLVGLASSLKEESFGHRIRAILAVDFDHARDAQIFNELRNKDLIINVRRLANGPWGTYRHIELNPHDQVIVRDDSAYLTWTSEKNINSLASTEAPVLSWYRSPPTNDDIHVLVHYSTFNYLDKLIGKSRDSTLIPKSQRVGWEFSGYSLKTQKRVMGVCEGNGATGALTSDSIIFQFDVPDNWPLESAVTTPIPYLLAYYCLNVLSSIKPSFKVFINGTSDGIEIAIISLCLSINCQVFIQLNSPSDEKTFRELFPSLRDENFIHANQYDLDNHLLQLTPGTGVDIAINTGSSKILQFLPNCCSFGGKIIQIGSIDESYALQINDQLVQKCGSLASFNPFDLFRNLLNDKNLAKLKDKLANLFNDGLLNNKIYPLPAVIINRTEVITKGLEILNNKSIIERFVIAIRDEVNAKPITVRCIAKTYFNSKKCYILIGGLGGIGLQLTKWMVSRGAKNIIITSRNGITKQYQRFIISRLKSLQFNPNSDNCTLCKSSDSSGANIVIINEPTSDEDSCAKIIKESIENYGPIGGIFNLAGILKSGLLENQTSETFMEVCLPKIEVTEHFDKLSRLHCPQLDYFVCFSSISALGILGEPNYGYANSYMDRLCEERRSHGLPGTAIQWGAVGDVGMARRLITGSTASIAGSAGRRVLGVIDDLDKFLQLPYSVCYAVQHATKQEHTVSGKGNILQRIGHILGCQSLDKLDGNTTLGSLGLDSLQAIEVKTLIDTTCNVNLSNIAILKLTISEVDKLATDSNQMAPENDLDKRSIEEQTLINLTDKGTEPIFFFPPAFFDFLSMMPVAEALNRTVVGVQLTEKVRSLGTFKQISNFYAETILAAYPNLKRYDFVGYSFGCTVAFELAKVLQEMIGKSRVDRIVFIDASPYGLKRLGQKTMKMVLAGIPSWEIFISIMQFMGVRIDEKTKRLLEESEDDEFMYQEVVTQTLIDAGMNGPTDSLIDNAAGMIDRTYYLGSMEDLGTFDGDALFIQVINKAVVSSGTSSLVNEGLPKIIKGALKKVMFNATHFDVLKVYAREVAAEIEKIMP